MCHSQFLGSNTSYCRKFICPFALVLQGESMMSVGMGKLSFRHGSLLNIRPYRTRIATRIDQIGFFVIAHQFTRLLPDCLSSLGKWQILQMTSDVSSCKTTLSWNVFYPPSPTGASFPSDSGSITLRGSFKSPYPNLHPRIVTSEKTWWNYVY